MLLTVYDLTLDFLRYAVVKLIDRNFKNKIYENLTFYKISQD